MTKSLKDIESSASGQVKKAVEAFHVAFEVKSLSYQLGTYSGDIRQDVTNDAEGVAAVCSANGTPIKLDHFVPKS